MRSTLGVILALNAHRVIQLAVGIQRQVHRPLLPRRITAIQLGDPRRRKHQVVHPLVDQLALLHAQCITAFHLVLIIAARELHYAIMHTDEFRCLHHLIPADGFAAQRDIFQD